MAVFWFGWAKKLKNIFTKQQADTYYLQKELPNQLQIVKGSVDFYKNVVVKQNGYVDRVDTNAPTSMINKRYFENNTLSKVVALNRTMAHNALSPAISNLGIDLTKPIIVRFTWTDTIDTSKKASHAFIVDLLTNEWSFGSCGFYLNTSNNNVEKVGDFVLGICATDANTIKLKASCINNNYRITNIYLTGYPKQ